MNITVYEGMIDEIYRDVANEMMSKDIILTTPNLLIEGNKFIEKYYSADKDELKKRWRERVKNRYKTTKVNKPWK